MYNLLIVDDEKLIREGITEVLSSCEDLHFNVFCAENGLQALETIKQEKIHAMILDIKMPKLDGIGVLKDLSEKRSSIKTVVLSGYEEFDYARVAIECGALNYLVKPIIPKDIIRVAREIEKELVKESKQNEELGNLRKQMQENLDLFKEKLFSDILSERINKRAFEERMGFLNLDIPGPIYQVAVIDIVRYHYFTTEEKCQLINYSIYQFLKGYIPTVKGAEYFQVGSSQFAVLFSMQPGRTEDVKKYMHLLKKKIDEKFNVSSAIGVGKAYTGFENIKRTYLEAKNTVRFEVLSGGENVVSIADRQGTNISLDYLFDAEEYLIRLKLGDISGVTAQLNEMFEKINEQKEYTIDIESFNLLCMKLVVYTFMALKELEVDLRSLNLHEKEVLLEMYELKSYEQVKKKIFCIIDKAANGIEEYRREKKKVIVEKVKNIINQNYEKEISIKFIAEQLCFNHNYLGQLFKNETSMSISDYLARVRVTKAKALLRNTDLMIYEIAEKVGFSDSQYFSTVFKKNVGVTPKEFKEI